ncbi:MAG: hypothetical protein AAFN13_12255 [Bacteroidota bacterium]
MPTDVLALVSDVVDEFNPSVLAKGVPFALRAQTDLVSCFKVIHPLHRDV